MTKVKICGITNLEDALLCVKFGADALGFNFYERSPRFILPDTAREIIRKLPREILKVGVFVNQTSAVIAKTASVAGLDALQLHGEESNEFAEELKLLTNLPVIKAFRVSKNFQTEHISAYTTDAILLDAYNPHEHGGTGETFDWKIARNVRELFPKMYLAGGLSAENVAQAISEVRPFAVDACSCLELSKGKKDSRKIKDFLQAVKMSDLP